MDTQKWFRDQVEHITFMRNKCFFLERHNNKEWLARLQFAKRQKDHTVKLGSGYVFVGDPFKSEDLKKVYGDWICFK